MGKIRAMAWTLGSMLSGVTKGVAQNLSLVPTYLAHLLWLISQEFASLAKEGYGGNAAVYAVLRFLTTSVAEPPLIAHTMAADGTIGDPLPWAHPLRQTIRSPNPFLTEFEHWEIVTLHLGIAGRYIGWKERDNANRVLNIWPLRPDRVGPIYGDINDGEPPIIGWSYLIPGTTRYIGIPHKDVILVNFPDPMGESGGLVEGLGPLQALAAEVSADNEATKFVGALVSNYAMPGVILQLQKGELTLEEAKVIKAGFMRDFGSVRRGEPAVLDEGITATSMGFSLQQLEFPGLRKVSESRIAAAFGVPAILAGLLVGLEAGIKATTDELRAMFAETTLATYWQRLEDALTNDLASEYGENIVCSFDLTKVRALAGQTLANIDRVMDAYSNGALTKNELREAMGYEPRIDGDVYVYGIAKGRGVETDTPPAGQDTAVDPAEATESEDATAATPAGKSLLTDGQDGLQTAFAELMAALDDQPTAETKSLPALVESRRVVRRLPGSWNKERRIPPRSAA